MCVYAPTQSCAHLVRTCKYLLYNVQCARYTVVQCLVCEVHCCTMFSVRGTLMYNVQCARYTVVQCLVNKEHPHGEQNTRRGRQVFRTLCFDVFRLLKNQFLRNNNNTVSRSNVNKHKLVNGESSSDARDARCLFIICVIVLMFSIFIIVVTQKLVLQRSKNVTAKCRENLSPPPCILYLLGTPLYIIQCLVYKVHCVQGTLYTLYNVQCTSYTVVYNVYCLKYVRSFVRYLLLKLTLLCTIFGVKCTLLQSTIWKVDLLKLFS